MEDVANGDITKASILFDRYHVAVYNYLAKVNRDKSLAEDLTQNAFEKLIKYRSSYGNKKSFKAWLFTIVRNVNIDHHRRKKVYSESTEILSIPDGVQSAQKNLETQEKNDQLMQAIHKLSNEEKEIILLTKV